MCDVKAEGGRRCPSSTPEGKRAYRARVKERRLAEAAVAAPTSHEGHQETAQRGEATRPQATAAAAYYDVDVAAYTAIDIPEADAREWADLPIDPVIGVDWAEAGYTPAETYQWFVAFHGSEEAVQWNYDRGAAGDAAFRHECATLLESALNWSCEGVTDPGEALTWELNGLDPDEAHEWLGTGIPVREAVQWYHNGIPAGDAPAWREAGFHQTNTCWWISEYEPAEAREWADAGVADGSTAQGWEQHDFTPNEAGLWIAAGCDCAEDAGRFVEVGTIPREHALVAYQCGYTADEAAGLDWDDPQVVDGLRTIGALRSGVFPSSPAA